MSVKSLVEEIRTEQLASPAPRVHPMVFPPLLGVTVYLPHNSLVVTMSVDIADLPRGAVSSYETAAHNGEVHDGCGRSADERGLTARIEQDHFQCGHGFE